MQRRYHDYIRSPEWREKADAAKRRAGYHCQMCNKSADEVQLDTHHRTYERLGDEWPEDLIVLCRGCHRWHHLRSKLLQWRGTLIVSSVIALGLYLLLFGYRNPFTLVSSRNAGAVTQRQQERISSGAPESTSTPKPSGSSGAGGGYYEPELHYPSWEEEIAEATAEAVYWATLEADFMESYEEWKRDERGGAGGNRNPIPKKNFRYNGVPTATSAPMPKTTLKPISTNTPVPVRVPQATTGSQNCEGGCTQYPSWCAPPIKGNVSFDSGEKIYHVPGQEYYASTTINTRYGERWFCTEAEARAAGWRKSKR